MKKFIMINFNEIFKKIFFNQDEKYFHAISFIVISLIAIHVSLYFNFYKLSSNWINNESKKTTFVINTADNEKEIPFVVKEKLINFLTNNNEIKEFKIIENETIINNLGLESFDGISRIGMPLIFQIKVENTSDFISKQDLNSIIEQRTFEEYKHKNEIQEISIVINRIKIFIFFMLIIISILFSFLILTVTRGALVSNLKFLEMLQIMGANSFDMARSISLEVTKKIIPGAFLSILFVFFISTIILQILGTNFFFSSGSNFLNLNFKNLILLVFFLIAFIILLLLCLSAYLFYFFEKRFFDKI